MNKVLFGHHGRYGDIMMGIPSIKYLSETNQNNSYYLNINKSYQDCAPLFYNQKGIEGVFISNEYEKFPDSLDCINLRDFGFSSCFNPMQPRIDEESWFKKRHQVSDVAYQYGILNEIECHKIKKINLHKWFTHQYFKKTIAFHSSPANYEKNNTKAFSREKSQDLVNYLNKIGYSVLEVGAKSDPKLENTIKFETDYFHSVKNILGCELFIGFDSGLTWTLSGYNFPVLAFYSDAYYIRDGINYVSSIQPENPNAIYISNNNVNEISHSLMIEKINEII